jgi:hypothetical protein
MLQVGEGPYEREEMRDKLPNGVTKSCFGMQLFFKKSSLFLWRLCDERERERERTFLFKEGS